jgi:hypothetical protein
MEGDDLSTLQALDFVGFFGRAQRMKKSAGLTRSKGALKIPRA